MGASRVVGVDDRDEIVAGVLGGVLGVGGIVRGVLGVEGVVEVVGVDGVRGVESRGMLVVLIATRFGREHEGLSIDVGEVGVMVGWE